MKTVKIRFFLICNYLETFVNFTRSLVLFRLQLVKTFYYHNNFTVFFYFKCLKYACVGFIVLITINFAESTLKVFSKYLKYS